MKDKGNKSKGRGVIKALIIIIVLLVVLFLMVVLSKNGESVDVENDTTRAILSSIEGTPKVKKSGETSYSEAVDGTELDIGDSVKTDDSSRALILFSDNSSVSLDYNSEITLESVPDGNDTKINIIQEAGKAWHRIEKLGAEDEYNVQTPTAIAAVRGTKFISHVASPKLTNIHTVESSVEVFPFIDGEKLEGATVEAGNWVDVIQDKKAEYKEKKLEKFIARFEQAKDSWFKFNECLDETVTGKIRNVKTLRKKFAAIKEFIKDMQECNDILGLILTPTPTLTETPTPSPREKARPAKIKSVTLSMQGLGLNCKWDAEGVISEYQYSLGSEPGEANEFTWQKTTSKSVNFTDLSANNGDVFYCNVVAKSKNGDDLNYSSGFVYDISSGDITNESNFAAGASPIGTLTISGNYSYNNMSANEVEIKFQIKKQAQYYGPNGWQADSVWFTPASITSNNFRDTKVDDFNSAIVFVELRNKLTGKVLDTAQKSF